MSLQQHRFVSDHIAGLVPSQRSLLPVLEQKGCEQGKQRIITSRAVGIPVTIYVLLARDSIASLHREQQEFTKSRKIVGSYTSEELGSRFAIQVNQVYPGADVRALNWEHSTPWTQTAESVAISGCAMVQQTNFLRPLTGPLTPPDPHVSLPNGATAYKGGIEIPSNDLQARPMIEVFKSTFFAIECFYALSERLSHEINNFERIFSATLPKLSRGSHFMGMCTRRGALVHSGDLSIKIDPATSDLRLGEHPLVDHMDKAFDEACTYAESTYAAMLSSLKT